MPSRPRPLSISYRQRKLTAATEEAANVAAGGVDDLSVAELRIKVQDAAYRYKQAHTTGRQEEEDGGMQ